MSTIAKFIAAVNSAKNEFSGWDWTMPKTAEDGTEYYPACLADAEAMPADVLSWAQEYDDAVDAAVEAASDYADEAVAALESGDIDEARNRIERAISEECQFGDSPAYRPLLEILDEIQGTVDGIAGNLEAAAGAFADDVGGCAMPGYDIWGIGGDPVDNTNSYTWDSAILYCVSGVERGIAIASARQADVDLAEAGYDI